jgi:pimeloyl-ACP methyl ester carboxylesterase
LLTSLADGTLLAEKSGSTPPRVVALHGWARSGTDFSRIVDGLDAVSIHLPGFGITAEPPVAWGSEDYAESLAAAIEPFGPVVVVGHSFGGRVAVRLAARRPDLVSGLVLTGVPLKRLGSAPAPALWFRILRSLARSGLVSKKAMEKQREKRGSEDYRNARGVMRDVLVRSVNENYDSDLARITAPTRMVWGENDTAAPADAGLAASKLISGSKFRVVPGAGHLLEDGLEAEVRGELLALVAEVEA